jgi:protein TonB
MTGGRVEQALLLHKTMPAYPRTAVIAHVSGAVELHAIIGTDGRIRELAAIGGHPLLIPAALEAVRQWVYRPTALNGRPVEVETTITVNFILGR